MGVVTTYTCGIGISSNGRFNLLGIVITFGGYLKSQSTFHIINLPLRYTGLYEMTFAIVKQLLSSGYVGMANYCLRQNITTRGYALGDNVLPQAIFAMPTYPLDSNCIIYIG